MEPKRQQHGDAHEGPPATARPAGAEGAGENGAGDGGEEKSGGAFNRGGEKQPSKRTSVRRSLPALIDVDDLNGLLDTEG